MTLIRQLKGFVNLDKKSNILVHFTSDNMGETISFAYGSTQFTLPYKPIEKMVERERAKGYTDGHLIINEEPDFIPVDWLEDQVDSAKWKEIITRWQETVEN